MLKELITKHAKDFGLINIYAEDLLNKIRQTAFSWTNTPGSVCLAMNKKYYLQACSNPNVVVIIAPPPAIAAKNFEVCTIVVEKADEFFYFLHNTALHQIAGQPDKMVTGEIAASAVIAHSAVIAPHVHVGENVEIGDGCIIFDNTIIGENVTIGPRCVIGTDGFFSKRIKGRKEHIKHFGGVRIGSNCKLHSGVTISCSANYNEFTEIETEVHIGHKSVIGHDCIIGQGTDISVNVLVAGRVGVGKRCWIGASSSISNACAIGDNAKIRIGATIISDVSENAEVSGNFAINHHKNLKRFLKER